MKQLEVIRKKRSQMVKANGVLSSSDSEDNDKEEAQYQVTDFVKGEWKSMAKFAIKINPEGAKKAKLNYS